MGGDAVVLFDAGNTALKAVRVEDGRFVARWRWENTALDPVAIADAARETEAVLASVRPVTTSAVRAAVPRVREIGAEIPCTVRHPYAPPAAPGVDRLMGALAAATRWGGNTVVVSAGSAITVDLATPDGLRGGCIFPGLHWSLDAVTTRGGLFAPTEFSEAESERLFGDSTRASLCIGVRWALVGAIERHVRRIAEAERVDRVVFTGGGVALVRPDLPMETHLEPDLVFRGMLAAMGR